ncbi:MAG: hypothetical protein L6R39_003715 [Caloplaca ligustica]|nr:MAG: hypothetical protein L6R39_003715 [Caloplaca ligustica]
MSKRSKADFFKPYAYPRQTKRPLPDGAPEGSSPLERSRSNTHHKKQQTNPPTSANEPILISSQTSVSSPLPDLPSSTPQELPNQTLAPSTTKGTESNPTSSFLGVEPFSQVPVISSSQRTVKNGEVIIRDSDEERSGTDSSLEDIDDLLRSRRPPTQAPSSASDRELSLSASPPVTRSKRRKSAANGKTHSAAATADHSPNPIARPKYRFSIDALIKQRQKENESRSVVENAQSLLEGLEEQKPLAAGTGNTALDERLLATVIRNDDDGPNMDRLMAAIERTEALEQQKTWAFFSGNRADVPAEPQACPTIADSFWHGILDDPLTRQQAFLSGYIGECTSFRKLPDDLLVWLLDAACHEARDDLHHSYCQALQDVGDQIAPLLSTSKIDSFLACIGARPDALDLQEAVIPTVTTPNPCSISVHAELRRFLDVHRAVRASTSLLVKKHIICILSRLLLDRVIVNDCTLLSDIEDVIEGIVDSEDHDVHNEAMAASLTSICCSVQDPGLQLQLLQNFPASSVRSSLLRRRLALAIFLHDQNYLLENRDQLIDFRAIESRLASRDFVVNSRTDYAGLAASISILAIGFDNGEPPPLNADKEAQIAFNNDIDVLAQRIKGMFTQIIDTSASHIKRTDAKQVLESFHSCLIYAVRTTQKPKGRIWDDDTRMEKQQSIMKGFIYKGGSKRDLGMGIQF